jgi:hypothetical protein
MNRSIATTGDFSPASPISKEELSQSLESLHKLLNNTTELTNRKVFILKTSYELGYYYYLNDDIALTTKYFNICINNCDEEDEKCLYFTKANLKKLLDVIGNEGAVSITAATDIEMSVRDDNVVDLFNVQTKENDFQSLFQKTQLDKSDKAIIEVKIMKFNI